tara:strand:+ start:266 stop:508 length:243 start_codon:yes stop_codon:yes gene_type:complete
MGFMRSKKPMEPIMDKLKPTPLPTPPIAEIPKAMSENMAETTQPGDLGKKSKKKGKGGTVLTSVTGVNEPANLGYKTLLG